jgi:ribonuclease-3
MDNFSEFVLFEYQKMHPKLDGIMLGDEFKKACLKTFKQSLYIQEMPAEILLSALSHKSFINEMSFELNNYERLEFLGDSLLELFVSEQLYKMHPVLKEGELSKLRSSIVNEEVLARVAMDIGLSKLILLGKGEIKERGFEKSSLLCNVFESLLGAIYISGGQAKAFAYLEAVLLAPKYANIWREESLKFFDAKSNLQEEIMKIYKTNPEYKSVEVEDGERKKV